MVNQIFDMNSITSVTRKEVLHRIIEARITLELI